MAAKQPPGGYQFDAFDGIDMQRIPSRGALSSAVGKSPEEAARQFAVHHETKRKRDPSGVPGFPVGIQDIKDQFTDVREQLSDTLRVFKEHGVIAQREYDENIPAAVHGAPKTIEESRETLERLRKMDNFDSQDFDLQENDVERKAQINRDHLDYVVEESWRWAIAFFIGLAMGLCAFFVDIGLETMNHLKFDSVRSAIRSSGGGFLTPYLTYMVFCLGFSGISGCLVAFVAPLAAGSGIPEIKTYLNGVHIPGLLSLRTLICKLSSVMCSMAGGLIAGKEGPFVHSGGIVGGGLGGMGSRSLTKLAARIWPDWRPKVKTSRTVGGFFRNDADHRDFTAIGTAAGVSTAFAAPIGGLLLAIEEGASFYSTGVFWRGFLATCTGVLTLHFLAQFREAPREIFEARLGIRRDLGLYNDDVALYGSKYFYYIWEFPIFVLMGVLAGVLGGVYIRLNVRVTKFRAKYIPARLPKRRLLEVLALAWATGTAFFVITYAAPCRKLPPGELLHLYEMPSDGQDIFAGGNFQDRKASHFPKMWCADDEYNSHAQLFFTPLIEAMRMIIHFGETIGHDQDHAWDIQPYLLFLWAVVVYTFMIFTFGIGAATGIFIPSLAVGGAWGRLVGHMIQNMVGHHLAISLPSYTVIGAASMLGGVTRMTLSITVLAMEGTGALQLIVPLMLSVFIAKMVGDAISLSVYDTHIKIKGAPVLLEAALESHQRMVADKLSVGELMTTQLTALPPVVRLSELVATLRKVGHQAFPITPDTEKAFASDEMVALHGVIARTTVLRLIKFRIGIYAHDPALGPFPKSATHIPADQQARWELLEKLEQVPLKIRKTEQEEIFKGLHEEELSHWLDLRPFMQRTPYVVQANASLSRAYRLFRTMGLRHLFIAPAKPLIMGVITRKDITEENSELALGARANQGKLEGAVPAPAGLPFIPYEDAEVKKPRAQPELETVVESDETYDERAGLVAHDSMKVRLDR